ncbi:Uncharacterized protein dnl_26080 [Desulfonema limicola]|uniref:Uncharacterized protein n=1 Tax=Desulfonema limicola TaxID=45656 RepID=A0A975GGH1_9BACT|nr:Uncharacterized protein dnl_26080 [Desulfonema limicola]
MESIFPVSALMQIPVIKIKQDAKNKIHLIFIDFISPPPPLNPKGLEDP